MKPAALLAWGVAALVLLSAQAAPTGDPKRHKDIFEINQEAGLLGRACPGFKCDKDCDFGYDTDADGCFVCSCIPENKKVLYQGDMLLDRKGKNRVLHGDSGNRGSVEGMYWPRVIPYAIEDSIAPGSSGRSAIAEAIADFHKHTCLRFTPRTKEEAYIKFYRRSGCSSPVGYSGHVNEISLATSCWHKGIVIHEIMHSLGFFHEQARPDRDDYVEIVWDNIQDEMSYNFDKRSNIDSLGTPYDHSSVMHYGKTAFGRGHKTVTIRAKDASMQDVIGQRSGLSKIDIQQLNLRYNCGGISPFLICQDKIPDRCPALKSLCSNSQDIQNNCPMTCGLCGGVASTVPSTAGSTLGSTVASTATSTAASTISSIATSTRVASTVASICEDKHSYCPIWRRYCSRNGFVDRNCVKTCGTCGGGVAPTAEPCQRGDGASYRGTVSVTETGKTCQRWDSQTPHGHKYTPANYPYSGLVQNYCRNPSGWSEVWCYTTDPGTRWERCDVPVCGGSGSYHADPAADPAETPAEGPCEDTYRMCPRLKRHCRDPKYQAKVKLCPKTCGTCGGGEAPDAEAVCEDMHPTCPKRKRHCGKKRMQKFCPKTCGRCARVV